MRPADDLLQILYVEDNDPLRETIGLLMEADGRSITLASSAEEALAAAGGVRFDLIVSDVSLPGLSGTDLAKRLLADDPQRWIILCSGHELDGTLDRLGPNVRALTKPFEYHRLEALIQEAVGALGGAGAG